MLTVTRIENGILTTLQGDTTLAAYCLAFNAMPSLDPDELAKIFRVFPAIGVIAGPGNYAYQSSARVEDHGLFYVLCFMRNLRSETSAVHGEGSDVGVWGMIEDCRRILTGATLGIAEVYHVAPQKRRLLFAGDKWAAASLEVQVRWRG